MFHEKRYNIDDASNLTESNIRDDFDYLFKGYTYAYTRKFLTSFRNKHKEIPWDKLYDKDYYVALYEERNQQIKKYFSDVPEKLLVIDVTKESDTSKICDFLNIPKDLAIKMPHLNKTQSI